MRRALALVPVALFVAGCGTEPSTFDNSSVELKNAGSSRVEFRLEKNPANRPFSWSGVGAMDYAKDRGELVVFVGGRKSTQSLRAVYIGRDTYMAVPYRGKTLWQKSPDYEATGPDRFAPGPGGPRPDEVLDLLVKASNKVERLGNDEIRGVSADHYRAHIERDADLAQFEDLVIDAWIDDDGLLRRIRIPFGGAEGPVEVIDLYDFGVPVNIDAPSPDEVVSQEEFNRLMDRECVASKGAGDENPWCLLFGGMVLSGSGGSDESSPPETIPRKVSDY
jgi:hypothetical protein